VLAGDIVAGPWVRAACQRHVNDLATGAARGLSWDAAKAEYEIDFYEHVLRLNGGKFEGKPFRLDMWQAFIIGSMHGWRNAEGTRRFVTFYIETGKGSGKSPLAAGIGLRVLTSGLARAEVYSAATKKEQATILFRDAVAMVRQSPTLQFYDNGVQRLTFSGGHGREYNIGFPQTASFFRPIASDEGQSGPRPACGLIDELHEHKDGTVIEMMRAGFKSNPEPILFIITNSGSGTTGVCRDYHDYSIKVVTGAADVNASDADTHFAYVCAMDDGDDPFESEACWIKANPGLPAIPGADYIRKQVAEAKGMPSKEAIVRRLNFCQWTSAMSPWLSADVWLKSQRAYTLADFRGRRCYGGLDLSSTTDTTAFVLAFEPLQPGGKVALFPFVWLPKEGLHEKDAKDRVPYVMWAEQGLLLTTPGKAISKRDVLITIDKAVKDYELDLVAVAYDRWGIEQLKVSMDELGVSLPLQPFGQGFGSMGAAVNKFEELLLNDQLEHPGHPILTSHMANAVMIEDAAGNRKPAKDKATGRIDLCVASIMAVGVCAIQAGHSEKSFWESE
jgi:phage terminase large subunit-like protein